MLICSFDAVASILINAIFYLLIFVEWQILCPHCKLQLAAVGAATVVCFFFHSSVHIFFSVHFIPFVCGAVVAVVIAGSHLLFTYFRCHSVA